jgi:hypothetical protein
VAPVGPQTIFYHEAILGCKTATRSGNQKRQPEAAIETAIETAIEAAKISEDGGPGLNTSGVTRTENAGEMHRSRHSHHDEMSRKTGKKVIDIRVHSWNDKKELKSEMPVLLKYLPRGTPQVPQQ